MKRDILVVFGGASPEYEVSCASAAALIGAISTEKYRVHCVGITREGRWILTQASVDAIGDSESWLKADGNCPAVLSPDRGDHGLLIFAGQECRKQRIDVVFPIIHGETGEDGKLQGLLELSGIPYVGCGVCASACSMDKSVTMLFADLCGLQCPEHFCCDASAFLHEPQKVAGQILEHFNAKLGHVFPLFVKPASTGSSIGISKVNNEDELLHALNVAAQFGGRLVVEENIVGKEIKVAVLGGGQEIRLGELCEIVVENGIFNDFKLKYKSGGSHKKIPAELPKETEEQLRRDAVAIYQILGCTGFSRVDFFVTEDSRVIFNEINTVPGFTRGSIYSLMMDKAGIPYEELVQDLIEMAGETAE